MVFRSPPCSEVGCFVAVITLQLPIPGQLAHELQHDFPVSISCCKSSLGLQMHAIAASFLLGSGDPNSGRQVCTASTSAHCASS